MRGTGEISLQQCSDEELVSAYKAGNAQALGELFNRYHHLVLGVCLKYTKDREQAADRTMEIFESLMQKLHKHQVENFRPWLHSLTRNHCLMWLRKKNPEYRMDEHVLLNHAESHELDEKLEQEKLEEKLISCIDSLKNEQRMCIRMFYLQKKCYAEISKALEMELKQVKSHIQNGRRNLRLMLDNKTAGA